VNRFVRPSDEAAESPDGFQVRDVVRRPSDEAAE
jgi:hypothetical protein